MSEPPHRPRLGRPVSACREGFLCKAGLQTAGSGANRKARGCIRTGPGLRFCPHPDCPLWKRLSYPEKWPLAEKRTVRSQSMPCCPGA